jgi:hypothetical protein
MWAALSAKALKSATIRGKSHGKTCINAPTPEREGKEGKERCASSTPMAGTEREIVRIKERASRDQSGRCHAAISTAKRTCHTLHLDIESESRPLSDNHIPRSGEEQEERHKASGLSTQALRVSAVSGGQCIVQSHCPQKAEGGHNVVTVRIEFVLMPVLNRRPL